MVARRRLTKKEKGHVNGQSKKSWVKRLADKAEQTSKDKKARKGLYEKPEFDTLEEDVVPITMPEKPTAYIPGKKRMSVKLATTYQPDYPKRVADMVLNGATERDVIVALGITRQVFRMWCIEHAEFAASLAIGANAALADERVKRALYEMAVGYEMPATKIMNVEGEIRKVKYIEQVPKNAKAAMHWLANRDPLNWGKDPDRVPDGVGDVINIKTLRSLPIEKIRQVLEVVRGIMKPGVQLQRLDVVDAEVENVDTTPPTDTKD